MSARRVRVRIARERTRFGDLVAEAGARRAGPGPSSSATRRPSTSPTGMPAAASPCGTA